MKSHCRTMVAIGMFGVLGVFPSGARSEAASLPPSLYARHPHLTAFFPFGVYGNTGGFRTHGTDPRDRIELQLATLAAHGINAVWDTGFYGNVHVQADGTPHLDDFGQWVLEDLLPRHAIRVIPSLQHLGTVYRGRTFAGLHRNLPLYNDEEMALVAQRLTSTLNFARDLAERYPGQSPWTITAQARWMAQNRPETTLWLIPLASSYGSGHEATLPGLPDTRPTRATLRLEAWSSLAMGVKGFFYYNAFFWMAGCVARTRS